MEFLVNLPQGPNMLLMWAFIEVINGDILQNKNIFMCDEWW